MIFILYKLYKHYVYRNDIYRSSVVHIIYGNKVLITYHVIRYQNTYMMFIEPFLSKFRRLFNINNNSNSNNIGLHLYYLVSVKFKLNVCSLRLVRLSNRYHTFRRFALTEYIIITCHIFVSLSHRFDIRII